MGLTHEHIPTKGIIIWNFTFSFIFLPLSKKYLHKFDVHNLRCLVSCFSLSVRQPVSQSQGMFYPIFLMSYIFTVGLVIYLKLTLWICVSLNDLFVCRFFLAEVTKLAQKFITAFVFINSQMLAMMVLTMMVFSHFNYQLK